MKKSNYVHALLWVPAVVGSFYLETFWYAKIRYIREVSFFDYRLTIIAVSMFIFTISMLLIYKIQERESKKNMSKEKQIEETADKVTHSSERQRRGEYVRRIVEAINYRGENDHEDLWSILYDFEQKITEGYRKMPEDIGEFSDGYHTFNELYHHRAVLFSVICNMFPEKAWKSKLHDTGDMYNGMFIVGIETEQGQATYHYDVEPYWDMFKVKELEKAPKYDGHTPSDAIERIGKLKQSEWISVEERLPERCGCYLGCTYKGYIMLAPFYPYTLNDKPQFRYDITHWMPLPEAPKGGAE